MRKKMTLILVGLALATGVSACASNPYGIPAGGPHFASWDHLKYSLFSPASKAGKPRLTSSEFETAKKEGWWGIPVQYTIDELE